MEGTKKIYVAGNYIEKQDFKISVSGDFHYHGGADFDKGEGKASANADTPQEPPVPIEGRIGRALKECKYFIWGNAAYGVVFCVCRDLYHVDDNASNFERILSGCGITIPEGTINSAMHRNPWMKYHVDKWEEYGVMARVMKLKNAFQEHMDKQCSGIPSKK